MTLLNTPKYGFNKKNLTTKCRNNYQHTDGISRCRQKYACDACLKYFTEHWTMRTGAEGMASEQVLFVTLTFNDENLHHAYGTHQHQDNLFKQYARRLRRRGKKDGWYLRYVACFEYGEKRGRPHFHAILFFERTQKDCKLPSWPLNVRLNFKEWKYGTSQYEVPRSKSGMIEYTFGYVAKKGGRLLRPSNGMGKRVLIGYAAMLGRNGRPLCDFFGIRIKLPTLRGKAKTELNWSDQPGKMKEYLLPLSHNYAVEMVNAYASAWHEKFNTEPPDNWMGRVSGDYEYPVSTGSVENLPARCNADRNLKLKT